MERAKELCNQFQILDNCLFRSIHDDLRESGGGLRHITELMGQRHSVAEVVGALNTARRTIAMRRIVFSH